MNKEELIRFYSAYLPYKLEVKVYFDDPDHSRIVTMCAIDTDEIYTYMRHPESWYISGRDEKHNMRGNYGILECKPILYDLSYLTKEIEHEGSRFVPLHRILEEYYFDLSKMDEKYILSFKESLIEVDMSYKTAQMLLSWHFNIFGLKENEFINKATLNK
ncbi:hypothetical protein [Chryseobacterium taichungense]|uniref:hypothetical protein n=1 Tax=Chryseobacterium taichungense TaxID=295069 RepID=UPI0028B1D98E|nr:hypothetical protein [Chryseobacterium taichungense]